MAAHLLEGDHHPGQLRGGRLVARAEVAELIVLAEDAAEVAVAEKDGPRAGPADQNRFFPEVRGKARNPCQPPGPADPFPVGQPVDPAVTGAEPAIFQTGQGPGNPVAKLFRFVKFQVGGGEAGSGHLFSFFAIPGPSI
ncbi:MAG: hypothetical protein R6W72_05065 [Desulfurivibrionaceae bacterium]